MNILVIDRAPPCNLLQGNALIGHHLFSRLQHHHLTLICPAPHQEIERYQAELTGLFDTVHLVPRDTPIDTLMGLVEPKLARMGKFNIVDNTAIKAFQTCVQNVVAAEAFDVIHTRQLPMAAITANIQHPAKLLELIDSETLQARRRTQIKAPKTWVRAICARLFEAWAVRQFHACTSVSDTDAQVIRRFAGGVPVRVMPNGVDATYFAPQSLPEEPETIVFTGAMSFSPNITAVLHFYRNILPLIRRERPDVRLVIVGRDPSPEIVALASDPFVTVTGFVEDMRPWLAKSSVVICPMLTGSGIKNKVLEALAMAKSVVSTTLGIEALDITHGRELLIADKPAEFAAATLALLRDSSLRQRLGAAGRELVLRHYTWDACAAKYDVLYTELAVRHGYSAQRAKLQRKVYENR